MKTFEEYLQEGTVKTITPDLQRAINLKLEAERKISLLENNIFKLGVDDENANDFVEYCYNIILFLIRAEMLNFGYSSSGRGAHEAEVAFTKNLNFLESETEFLDELRYFRNGILYYGKRFDKYYAEKCILFAKELFLRFKD